MFLMSRWFKDSMNSDKHRRKAMLQELGKMSRPFVPDYRYQSNRESLADGHVTLSVACLGRSTDKDLDFCSMVYEYICKSPSTSLERPGYGEKVVV